MPLTLDENQAKYQIRSYQPGCIQVNEQKYYNSIIVGPDILLDPWRPLFFSDLKEEDFKLFLELKPAILLIGTGEILQFPPLTLYGELINHGIGVEIMDTRRASHTYNALTAENRQVMAALISK